MVTSLYNGSCLLPAMDGLLKQRSTVFGTPASLSPTETSETRDHQNLKPFRHDQPNRLHRSLYPVHRNGRARRQVKLVPAYLCQFTTVAAAWELSIVTGGWQQEALPSSIQGMRLAL